MEDDKKFPLDSVPCNATAKYYDFDPFRMLAMNPAPSEKYPFVEVCDKNGTVVIKTTLNENFSFTKTVVKKTNHFYEYTSHIENDMMFTYERFYTKDKILEYGFQKDLLGNAPQSLFLVTEFTKYKKTSIQPNETLDIQPSIDFEIDSFPQSKIFTKKVEEYTVDNKCLSVNKKFKSYSSKYENNESLKYCYNKFPFNNGRFSYYWYIYLPNDSDAHLIRAVLEKYKEGQE